MGVGGALNASVRGSLSNWPGHSMKTSAADLLAVQRPPALVNDDGMVFFDQGLDHSPEAMTAFPDIRSPSKSPHSAKASLQEAKASSVSHSLVKAGPKLLKDLEYFLNTELEESHLDGTEHVGNPERTRIFFECLDCFIEHCATYQPLLSKIKGELEAVIAERQHQISQLQPLQLKVATLKDTSAQDRIRLQQSFRSDTSDMRDEMHDIRSERNEARAKVGRLTEELHGAAKELERLRDNAEADWEQNSTLSTALNHHKLLMKDTSKIYTEREELSKGECSGGSATWFGLSVWGADGSSLHPPHRRLRVRLFRSGKIESKRFVGPQG